MATQRPSTLLSSSPPSDYADLTSEQRQFRPRRDAANKASTTISGIAHGEHTPEPINKPPEDLLAEALAPIEDNEQDDWKSWVLIESEPAFFNGLLRDLGVKDVHVAELLSVDEVGFLPKPILGFVLLCEYAGEEGYEGDTDAPTELWFANQSMENGCATVALLNIVMNAPCVQLGDSLSSFKSATQNMPSILRGYQLESNKYMRTIHNAYARRIELLNADLHLSGEFQDCNGVPESDEWPKTNKTKAKKPPRNKKRSDEESCHYKAFVHLAGQVWILDGLEWNPVCVGEATEDTWISLAMSEIVKKIEVAGNMVNILAVCQSPVVALRTELAVNVKTLSAARAATPGNLLPRKTEGRLYLEDIDEAQLHMYGVSRTALNAAEPALTRLTDDPGHTRLRLIRDIETEQAKICANYSLEMELISREAERCSGRKNNFTPAVNLWLRKLAAQGVLEGLLSESNQ